jgi:hypothetical protein
VYSLKCTPTILGGIKLRINYGVREKERLNNADLQATVYTDKMPQFDSR